ncbi:MAG: DNA repair protein RadC [Bacteroidota bacterium]
MEQEHKIIKGLILKDWAEEDRPREKFLLKGKQALSDAELLAILLRSGSRSESVVSLSQRILSSASNNLSELGRHSLEQLMEFKGIGKTKAITIIAAMELGRRRQMTSPAERPQIRSSKDAFDVVAPTLMDLPHEEFWILLLNRANQVVKKEQISRGGTAGTVVDAKIVFRKALAGEASSIILVHNHPSGNLRPSQADKDITQKLKTAGKALDIAVLDHLIVSSKGYYSFADEGIF